MKGGSASGTALYSHCTPRTPLPATPLALPPALAQAPAGTQPSHHQLNVNPTAGLVDESAESNGLAASSIASQVGGYFQHTPGS